VTLDGEGRPAKRCLLR